LEYWTNQGPKREQVVVRQEGIQVSELAINPKNMVKSLIKRTPLYDTLIDLRLKTHRRGAVKAWHENGRPVPPPHVIKERTVAEYARRFDARILIETGTYLGDMVDAVKASFDEIYSIELSRELADQASEKFKDLRNVHILQGNSPEVLAVLLPSISGTSIIWLDAHYSAGITARGTADTPITDELRVIFDSLQPECCLLIDDARCFNGQDGYPTIAGLQATLFRYRPDWVFEIEHDIIRCHPPTEREH
jgi:hypothetical protein